MLPCLISCDTCGTRFIPDERNHKRNTHNFCSRRCYYDFDDAPTYVPWHAPDTVLGYVAGFFDAEGNIGISPNGATHLLAALSNTHLGVMETIQAFFTPAVIPLSVIPSRNPRWSTHYRLVWQSHAAVVFLEALMPWLVTKKARAKIGLTFQRLSRPQKRGAQGKRLTQQLSVLNTRGIVGQLSLPFPAMKA